MPTSEDIEEEYEVERIVGCRKKNGRIEYLIKWKGYSSDENTWEPEANLNEGALEEARAYQKSQISNTADMSPLKRPRLDNSSTSSGNPTHYDVVAKKEHPPPSERNKKVAQDADVPGKEHTTGDDSPTKQEGNNDGATEVGAVAMKREFETDTDDERETPAVTGKMDSQVKLKQEYAADTDDDADDDVVGNNSDQVTRIDDTTEGNKQLKEEIGRVIRDNVDDLGSIEDLIRKGASIDATYAIHVALSTQSILDAKFKHVNRFLHVHQQTPRTHLSQSSFNKLLRKLIEFGGDVQLADQRGEQPLHLAAAFPHHNIDSIKILIEAGADVSAKAGDGCMAAERIRAKSHEVGDRWICFEKVREDDVIPPFEALSALMTNEQRQKHVDGWLSPRMKWMLMHISNHEIDDMVDNPSLGLSNTLLHIPAEVVQKYNSKNGHWSGYYECAKEFQLIFSTISSLLESDLSPTVDRVSTRLNGVPDFLHFTRNGGKVEFALDYILSKAKNEGEDYVFDFQSEIENLDTSSLDGMYDLTRFMLINRGGGDTYGRGPYGKTRNLMTRVHGYFPY